MNDLDLKLYNAAEKNDVAAIRELVAQGANVNAESQGGFRPAHMAAVRAGSDITAHPTIETLKVLHELGADMKARTAFGASPFSLFFTSFVQFGRMYHEGAAPLPAEALDWFQSLGVDVNEIVSKGNTPLLQCGADIQHHDIERGALQKYGFKLDAVNDEGVTLPHLLAQRSNAWALEQMVKHGYSINVVDNAGRTPLHYHAAKDRLNGYGMGENGIRLLEVLKQQGVDLWAKDQEGHTALDLMPTKRLGKPNDDARALFAQQLETLQPRPQEVASEIASAPAVAGVALQGAEVSPAVKGVAQGGGIA